MHASLQLLTAALPLAAAWPTAMHTERLANANSNNFEKRAVYPKVGPPKFTTNRDNCGSHGKCTVFNEEDQFIDVRPGSGHAFKAPGPNDLRGQCPGLNAAANHGFLPRNGIATTLQTVEGLGAAYSMSKELAAGLAVIAIAISGDPIARTWSIGEGFKPKVGLTGMPTGIVGTHSRYEGDASIVRGDAYLHDGFVGAFEMHKWDHLYSMLGSDGLTHDKAAAQAKYTADYSIMNNPYYFSAPFSGLVAPDAHNFVVHFMSNRSAENKGGVLHSNVLKSFFAVTGSPGKFPMDTVDTNVDTAINDRMYPGVIRFGGNTGKTNSFVGLDLGDLTNNVHDGASIFEGNNLSCFFLQATQAGLSDSLQPLLQPIGKLRQFLLTTLAPQIKALNCPQLKSFDNSVFNKYPGASYTGQ